VIAKIRKIFDYFCSAPIRLFYWFVPTAALLELLRYLSGANELFGLLAPIVLIFFLLSVYAYFFADVELIRKNQISSAFSG